MLRSFAWRCVTSGVKPSQRRHLRSLAFKLQVGIIRKCSCLRFHCSLFFFFSFFSSSSLQHVQFLHLGVSPAESRHTAAHSLLNKPEASQSQERLSCTQEKTSGAHTLRVSCSMVCVHPLAFCRTNLGTLTHTHTHSHIYTWRQTYARSTHTSEEDAGGSVWVIEHVNGNVESSSYKQTSVETRGDRKWRLEEM